MCCGQEFYWFHVEDSYVQKSTLIFLLYSLKLLPAPEVLTCFDMNSKEEREGTEMT